MMRERERAPGEKEVRAEVAEESNTEPRDLLDARIEAQRALEYWKVAPNREAAERIAELEVVLAELNDEIRSELDADHELQQ